MNTRIIALLLVAVMVASAFGVMAAAAAPAPRIVKPTVTSVLPKSERKGRVGYQYTVYFKVTADNKALGRVNYGVGSADVYRQLPGQRMTTVRWKNVGISNSADGTYSYGSFTDLQYKPGTVTYLVKYKGTEVLGGPSGGSSYSIIQYAPSSASIGVPVKYQTSLTISPLGPSRVGGSLTYGYTIPPGIKRFYPVPNAPLTLYYWDDGSIKWAKDAVIKTDSTGKWTVGAVNPEGRQAVSYYGDATHWGAFVAYGVPQE